MCVFHDIKNIVSVISDILYSSLYILPKLELQHLTSGKFQGELIKYYFKESYIKKDK